jgi:NADH dehydrogenase
MSQNTPTDLVTGAFSYSGAQIAEWLLRSGRGVRTLTYHPNRQHPLRASVDALEYRFDDPAALARSLAGVSTLYNTFWVRFDHGKTSFANAIERSRMLFFAAKRAGVKRIVHLSITNPSLESPLPYFRGKALVESALAQSGLPYTIVRPTVLFGGERDVLVNNIAWVLRRMPVFPVPGDGRYRVQPVHVDDLARLCVQAAAGQEDEVIDAAGPEQLSFARVVALVRDAVGAGWSPTSC